MSLDTSDNVCYYCNNMNKDNRQPISQTDIFNYWQDKIEAANLEDSLQGFDYQLDHCQGEADQMLLKDCINLENLL